MSGHAPDEATDGLLWDLRPDMDQGVSQLLRSLWRGCHMAAVVDVAIHDVPEVTDWNQVWGSDWHVKCMCLQDLKLYHVLRVPCSVDHAPVTPDKPLEMNSLPFKTKSP